MSPLSKTMRDALAHAPLEWEDIPLRVSPSTLLRWTTVLALEIRGLVQKRLRGQPRAKWQWRVKP
mgnify:CR=1 FL=1